jgi:hypothetical protein
VSVIRQLSIFGVEASAPEPGDLAGLLAGGGQVVRLGGTARVSVVVDHPWRAAVLVAECARRGLAATCVSTVEDHIGVRTAFSALLTPLAETWLTGAVKRAPRGLILDGRALRLWAVAAGRRDGATAYALPLGRSDEAAWESVGAALAAVGLAAQLVSPRGGAGPSYRLVGRRRVARLAEMVGEPPRQAPVEAWPS